MYTLALLIDSDNIKLKYLKNIIQFCEVQGRLKTINAYGDWNQPPLSPYYPTLTALGVNCVQQNRGGKNATDLRLAMDVALMLVTHEADIYFLVSSDGDFTAVCEQIREFGAQVIGIGSEDHTSSKLREACTLFFDMEAILKTQNEASLKFTPPPTPKPIVAAKTKTNATPKPIVAAKPKTKTKTKPKVEPKLTPPLEMLLEAYQKAPQENNGWVHLGQIGVMLRQLNKHYEKRFTKRKLMTRFQAFPQNFEISNDRVRVRQVD